MTAIVATVIVVPAARGALKTFDQLEANTAGWTIGVRGEAGVGKEMIAIAASTACVATTGGVRKI